MVASERHRVHLCNFPGGDAFLDEVCAFPDGRHDDIVDAFSDLVRELQNGGGSYDLEALGGAGPDDGGCTEEGLEAWARFGRLW